MEHYLYITVDLCCFIVPFLFSYHPRLHFHLRHRSVFLGIAMMMLVFIPWDAYFTVKQIWGFNDQYILGAKLIFLPIEEWLFFICIPYACLFTYESLSLILKVNMSGTWKVIATILGIIMLLVGLTHLRHFYTASAHLLCGALLLAHVFILKSRYIAQFLITFLIILIPFVISNGILTGVQFWNYPLINFNPSTVSDMVVWYNNDHNLGIRIFSIPLDDVAYGMSMLLLTTTVFEMRKSKTELSHSLKTS